MHKSIPPAQEHAIRERLLSEAAEIRPAYSEAFHQRLVSAVERQRQEDAILSRRDPTAQRERLRRWVILAAACVLGAVLLASPFAQRADKPADNSGDNSIGSSVAAGVPQGERQHLYHNAAKRSDGSPGNSKNAQVAELQKIGDLTVRAEDHFDGLLTAATTVPQSAELKHDTRLVAQMLLRRLPVDVDMFAGSDELQESKNTSF